MAWGDYIEAKQAHQQDIQSTNITSCDVISAVAIITLCVLVIIGIVLVIKKTSKQAIIHSKSDKQHRHLETFALWRFSKVLFWVIVIVVALFSLLYRDYYGHYPLARLGVVMLIFSYPVYILFRHISFYIAYGKTQSKGKNDKS